MSSYLRNHSENTILHTVKRTFQSHPDNEEALKSMSFRFVLDLTFITCKRSPQWKKK